MRRRRIIIRKRSKNDEKMRIVQLINETKDIYYIQYEYDNQSINRRNVR